MVVPIITVDIDSSEDLIILTSPEVRNVHGSIYYNGYIYGSTRYMSTDISPNKPCIVKIKADDFSQILRTPIYYNTGLTNLEALVKVNNFLYAVAGTRVIIQYNLLDDTYKYIETSITTPNGFTLSAEKGAPLTSDERYIYMSGIGGGSDGQYYCYKIDTLPLESSTLPSYSVLTESSSLIVGIYTSSTNGGYAFDPNYIQYRNYKGYVHSALTDNNYLWLAYTTPYPSASPAGYWAELHKVDKTTMTAVDWCYVPQATDDMTQDDNYIFLGVELGVQTGDRFGFGKRGAAIRKSDMTLTMLGKLSEVDTASHVNSYASLVFGDYLIEGKVDRRLYIIDKSHPNTWNTDPNYTNTLAQINFTIDNQPWTSYNWPGSTANKVLIPNEFLLDFDTQTFYAFLWHNQNAVTDPTGGPSGVMRFKIDDFSFNAEPQLTSSFEVTNNDVLFNGFVTQSNGTILNKGFIWDTNQQNVINATVDNLSNVNYINIDTEDDFNYLVENLISGVGYFKAFATNSSDTGYSTISQYLINPSVTASLEKSEDIIILYGFEDTPEVIQEWGFYYGYSEDNLIKLSVPLNQSFKLELTNLQSGNFYYKSYVISNNVETQSNIYTNNINYVLTGKIFNKDGLSLQSGRIYIIDPVISSIIHSQNTNSEGEYLKGGLIGDRKYLVTGYYILNNDVYRAISKMLKPSLEL